MWNQTIDKVLHEMGFERFVIEHGIYVVGEGDERNFLALYVYDFLIVWSSRESLVEVKERPKLHFQMEDMGSAHFLLVVEIRRRLEGGYFLVQEKVVRRLGMADAKIVPTPFELGSTFGFEDALGQERVDSGMVDVPYRSLVGSLMYLAICTRLDLLGPLPIVPSASLVSVPNPHLCASGLVFSCVSSCWIPDNRVVTGSIVI